VTRKKKKENKNSEFIYIGRWRHIARFSTGATQIGDKAQYRFGRITHNSA